MPQSYYIRFPTQASSRSLAAICLALVFASSLHAGFYYSHEPMPFHVKPDGTADELSFGKDADGDFPRRLATLANEADSNPARASNPDRKAILERIAQAKPPNSIEENLAHAANLFRVDRVEDAMKLLEPLSRERIPDFRVLADLAHMHARLGEWDEATSRHQSALLDAEFPELPELSAAQRNWLKAVEQKYYARWLKEHRRRAVEKTDPEAEEIFPLFDMQFHNDRGSYEPGKLAVAERAKLPKDAIAITQQMLLWAPWDTSIYWLLAELYAAEGRFHEAEIIFDQCAGGRQFSNRKRFMEHRTAIREASRIMAPEKETVPNLENPPETPHKPREDFLPSRSKAIIFGAGFLLLATAMAVLQIRSLRRRLGAGRK